MFVTLAAIEVSSSKNVSYLQIGSYFWMNYEILSLTSNLCGYGSVSLDFLSYVIILDLF
jgi:hypothetical protein